MKKALLLILVLTMSLSITQAAQYKVDIRGMHAAIQFKVKHLGYSWLIGRFDKFDGSFQFDEKKIEDSSVTMTIDTTSVNSNHAERDKHLKSEDFLNVAKHPKATFVSKKVEGSLENLTVTGDFTLNGVTKELVIKGKHIGGGKDPWGGFRQGFEGTTSFKMSDFNMKKSLGPKSEEVYLNLYIEGIKR